MNRLRVACTQDLSDIYMDRPKQTRNKSIRRISPFEVCTRNCISRAHNWTHYWSIITLTKRVEFERGSRAKKFRVKTNRLAGQLIAAKAFAIILKRK